MAKLTYFLEGCIGATVIKNTSRYFWIKWNDPFKKKKIKYQK
jgi:hypothetical protein